MLQIPVPVLVRDVLSFDQNLKLASSQFRVDANTGG
jgi:hypothetical protein